MLLRPPRFQISNRARGLAAKAKATGSKQLAASGLRSRDLYARRYSAAGTSFTAYHALAQKFLTQALTPISGNMITPPTVTVGLVDGFSLVRTDRDVFNPSILPNPDMLPLGISGGQLTDGSSGTFLGMYVQQDAIGTLGQTIGWGYRFTTSAPQFDLCYRNLSSDSTFNVRVNGKWVQTADFTTAPTTDGGHFYYTRFDFGGDVSAKLIEVYNSDGVQWRGMNVGNGSATVFSITNTPQVPQTLMTTYGDSYVVGVGTTLVRGTFDYQFADLMGTTSQISSGCSGTGYIADASGTAKTFINRIADLGRVNTPEMIIVAGGINDAGQVPATLQAAVTAFWTAVRAAYPNALLICMGAWQAPTAIPSNAIQDAIKNGFAAVNNSPRMKYFDTRGTSYQDTSNLALYAADQLHPSNLGSAQIGATMATNIKAWLATL